MQAPIDPEATIKKAREELEAALRKKRAVDKQLVGLVPLTCGLPFLTRTRCYSTCYCTLRGMCLCDLSGYARAEPLRIRI